MTSEEARSLAYEWHGGQWSPLYAFASSGLVKEPTALRNEIVSCLGVSDSADREALKNLLAYTALHVKKAPEGARWQGYFAPWAVAEWVVP